MTPEQAKALRESFKPEQIGKLPKPTKKENPKGRCDECGGWHGLPAVHLDYVGHAATTDRLLAVDPEWSWEPMATGPNGEPLMTHGGLWIRLTVAGVTRPGFGDGANPKEIIGDAIRNAAMRFGVALDLWAKEDLHGGEQDSEAETPAQPAEKPVTKAQHGKIGALVKELNEHGGEGADWVDYSRRWIGKEFGKKSRADLTVTEAGKLIDHLEEKREAQKVPFG